MKRIELIVIIVLVLSLSGCVKQNTATEEQSNAVAEYMAGMILDSDEDYDQELVSTEEVSGEDITNEANTNDGDTSHTSEITHAPSDNSSGTPNHNDENTNSAYTLSEVIGNTNFNINYESYQLVDAYHSDDAYFVLSDSVGYKYLVVNFAIKNIADSKQTLNLSDGVIEYELIVNSGAVYSPLLALLENDIRYIEVKIDEGKSSKGILIFEVPDNTDISNVNLAITNDNKTAIINIK